MQFHSFKCSFKGGLLFPIVIVGIFVYWLYLAFVTQPILVQDAKGYQDLGAMIYEKGWKNYFITGPNREPIYPGLIALAMQWAGQGSYQTVLKLLQVFLLLVSLVLTFVILSECKISSKIKTLAILCLGISPAFVNSALSVYSEIATYVPILGIILVSMKAWPCLQEKSVYPCFGYGAVLGLFFTMITLVKGIYEIIFPLFLIVFIVLGCRAGFAKNKCVFRNVVIFLLATVMVFGFFIGGYKALNKKYNGTFVLTDRGAWALYGNTARRQELLTPRSFWAGIAYNLFEEDDCAALLDRQSCHFWDVATSDDFASEKNYEVIKNFAPEEYSREFSKLILNKILSNPLQYVILTGFDWIHMFFWESTRIGFVAYPDWLDRILDNVIFAKSLRFIVGFLSLGATILSGFYFWRYKDRLWHLEKQQNSFLVALFFLIYLIFCHVTLYSLFATVPRFALPIAPLFVLVIAFTAQILFYGKSVKEGI